MKVLASLIAAAAALAASSAPAQVHGQAPAVPSGAARAEGTALLAQAGATDLFDNLTGEQSQSISLKHKASGLICVFNPGQPANRIVLFDSPVRGEDIACSTGGEAGERTLYASHTPGRTLADAFAHDVGEVKRAHPDIRDYALPRSENSPILQMLEIPPMPPSKTARFIVDHQFTTVSSAVYKDWSLEFRFTCAEAQEDLAADALQPTLWVSILAQISGAPLDLISPKQAV